MCDIREQVDDLAKSIYGIHLRILIRRNVPCILNFRLPRRHTTCVLTKEDLQRRYSKDEARNTKTRNSDIAGTRWAVELCNSILEELLHEQGSKVDP